MRSSDLGYAAMPDGQETSLEELRTLIEENERSLRQAKRLLEWLEAYLTNEANFRLLELSGDESERQIQAMTASAPRAPKPDVMPIVLPESPPTQGSQLSP